MSETIRVLDLFSGAGGSSYGARNAGASIVGGVDAWDIAARTYSSNFGKGRGINLRLEGESVAAQVRAVGKIDLLIASPECTSHTCARGARPRSDDSRMTAFQVTTHAKELRPRWIVIENVIHMKTWERYGEFLAALAALGYGTTSVVLDSVDFGVAQTRRRLFIVCGRDDHFEFALPEPVARRRDARSVLDRPGTWPVTLLRRKGRAKPTLERAERAMKEVGANEPFLLVYYGTDGSGGWQSLDRPLRTLTTLDRFALVEPSPAGHTMRMLQVPELVRAMGFGTNLRLDHGTRRDKIKLLGNGVCPPVMAALVRALSTTAETREHHESSYFLNARRLAEPRTAVAASL